MVISESSIPQGTVVGLSGRIDNATAVEVQKKVIKLLENGKKKVFVDFKDVNYLSSAGMRALILISKKAKELAAFACLINVSPDIEETLEMTGSLSFIRIFPDLENAIEMTKE